MLACATWLADDFLLRRGFTITAPGDGRSRLAQRGDYVSVLEPACTCPDCPPHDHPAYRRLEYGGEMTDPGSREGRLDALDRLVAAAATGLRLDDSGWCAHVFWRDHLEELLERITPPASAEASAHLFAKLPACRSCSWSTGAVEGWGDAA